MKRFSSICLIIAVSISCLQVYGGNPDRSGQAGAYELLINPWARSSGWGGLNTASIRGLEAMRLNVAGLSFTEKTELAFANTNWLDGSGIIINSFGFAQKLGQEGAGGVLGFNIMAMDPGDIEITTTDQPEGGLGSYSPQFINIGLAFSKEFSRSIHGGVVIRGISESSTNVKASGIALDAGVQYSTGPKSFPDKMKFGISLRNVGTPLRFSGDGLSTKRDAPQGDFLSTMNQRTEKFELPSLLHVGLAYAIKLDSIDRHNLIIVGNFTSNAFYTDQIGLGVEYGFRKMFFVRAGYKYEKNLFNAEERTTALSGFIGGASFEVPFKKTDDKKGHDSTFSLDYSYRSTSSFKGCHSIGIRFYL